MPFPQSALPIKAELQINSVWTDITPDVRGEQQIHITRGRSDESGQTDTTRCTFTLDNNSGNYSPRNPVGAYYGKIGRNTPCRVSVLTGTPYLDVPGALNDYAGTPDVPALDITGDLDVRIDASLVNWLAPAAQGSGLLGTTELMAKLQGNTQKSWLLASRSGRLYFEWSANGSSSQFALSTIPPVIPGSGRLAVRATLDVDNGAGGWTVRFYTAATLDSPWTQLGDPVTGAGVTSIFNSTSPVRIGDATNFTFTPAIGRVHSAEIRNGLWGTVVAQPYFSQQTVGTTAFVDSAGRTWTLNGATSVTNRQTRFVGEISSWPVRWETKKDVVVNVEASGILRRMTQGSSPVRSSMYREFTNPTRTGIVGYWPMEDEASATSFASAVQAQLPMSVPSSGVTLAAFSGWPASAALPTYTFGTSKAPVPAYSATSYIFTRFFTAVPAAGVSGTDRLFSFTTTGTARTWSVFINSAGNMDLRAYDQDGTQLIATGFVTTAINGLNVHVGVELTQNGPNIDATLIVFYIGASTMTSLSTGGIATTLNANTVGAATEVRVGQSGLLNGTAVGHMAVASSNTAYASTANAMLAWAAETPDDRVWRLGQEEGFASYSVNVSTQTMGVQGQSSLVDLLREAEGADEGILCEGRSYLGLRLRNHTSLNNQQPALTLDYTGTSGLVTPLEPTDDDQNVRNDVTVQRTNGSSSRLTLDTGPLSTLSPPSGVGRYADSSTLNLATDVQPLQHAGWRLHVGTWDETRYPVVHMVLSKVPSLLETAASVDIGDRIQILNPPPWLPPDTIDLMVQGYTETLDQFTWNLDLNCTPAGPWDVAWLGSSTSAAATREFSWLDTSGSALAEDLTPTETDVDVLTTPGLALWTPNVRDTPFDWRVAGEVMTVTAPGGLVNGNAFFDTDASGWVVENSSIGWSQNFVHPHPRAKGSLRIVPDGINTTGGAWADLTATDSITPGASYVVGMWVFSVNGWSDLRPLARWYTNAGAFISTSSVAQAAVPASVWTYQETVVTAPATAGRVRMQARHGGTPTVSDIYYVWAVRATRVTSSWLSDTFARTAASTWGLAESGQTWQTGGGTATDYNVTSGWGAHVLATTNASRRCFVDCLYTDFDVYASVTTSATATGGSLYGGPTGRYIDSDNLYQARLEFTTANVVILSVRKRVATVETQLGTATLSWTHVPGTFMRVRFQASGTTLRARAWRAGDVEPGVWHVVAVDSSITTSSFIGLRSISATGTTNVNPEIRYDSVEVINPQTYTVVRSANRAVKAQSAGAAVVDAYPPTIAL